MSQPAQEATRVMQVPATDRTLVAGSTGMPISGAAPVSPNATAMGVMVTCAVCQTSNPGLESYCVECGFLLASAPGEAAQEAPSASTGFELVENASGRRFDIKEGETSIGREGGDILLLDGTVSRRHAHFTLSGGTLTLTDEGSTNGSQVNGVRLAPNAATPVPEGATLKFGNVITSVAFPATASAASEPTIAVATTESPMAVVSDVTMVAPASAEVLNEVVESEQPSNEPPTARFAPASPSAPEILIGSGKITIGRRAGNDVILDGDPYVSGSHAEITSDANGCYLIDVGSTNGTVINGQRLEPGMPQMLLDGDSIQIGQAQFTFETLAEEDEVENEEIVDPTGSDDQPNSEPTEAPGE